MKHPFIITNTGELIVSPSSTSSQNDFDFFVGKWDLKNRKLKERLNACNEWTEFHSTQECYKILNGLGNIDNFLTEFDGVPFEGMSLRLFNPKTKLWSIYWADSNAGTLEKPVQGSFDNNIGYFYTKDSFQDKDILVTFKWEITDINNVIWSQAFSEDNGITWEWNWYMYMSRIR
jgi:hypothetical protein